MTDDQMIQFILNREGSRYTDHPLDRGGPTKYGITIETLNAFMGREVTPEIVKSLRLIDAVSIYRAVYLSQFQFIQDPDLKFLLFDSAVQHGTTRAIKWLQECAGVHADGHIGPITKDAVAKRGHKKLFKGVYAKRQSFYADIVKNDHSQAVFISGWMNRLGDVLKVSEL